MSLTIDQQRQRVEQEMTRMVDDLDKSTMRKMQVKLLRKKDKSANFLSKADDKMFIYL